MRAPYLASAVFSLATCWSLATASADGSDPPQYQHLPPLREQAELQNAWTAERIAGIPAILKKHNVDAWLISQREYAEETVFWSLKSAQQFSARRRTTYLFLADTSAGSPSSHSWIDNTPHVWEELAAVLEEHDPKTIAVDAHPEIAFASGLHAGELDAIERAIGDRWASRFVVKPMVAVEFIGRQVDAKLGWYRQLMETAWAVIDEGFSESVVEPGHTTTDDVAWWMRDKLQALNYTTWFQPGVSVIDEKTAWLQREQRREQKGQGEDASRTIRHGDLLHVDFGVTAMGMNTDTQHLAYVLHPGETESDIPRGLRDGLAKGNRLQDIVRGHMRPGRTGNAVLRDSLAQMRHEGIAGKVYCHAVGDWGHSAGAVIGMTNLQDGGVPVLGDLPLIAGTWYSVELMVEHYVPERGATLQFPLEEDVYWDGEGFEWVRGRQEQLLVVRSEAADGETWSDL